MFQNASFTPFFLAMKGYNKALMVRFCNSWQNGIVTIGMISFTVMLDYNALVCQMMVTSWKNIAVETTKVL